MAQKLIENIEKFPKNQCVFVDCFKHFTRMAIFAQIALKLGLIIPRRGLATDEVLGRIVEHLEKSGERVLVVLDQVDGLVFNHQQKVLYDLTAAGQARQLFCLVCVCDDPRGFTELDSRIIEALRLIQLEISPFSKSELEMIFNAKANAALSAGSFSEETIGACVGHSFEHGSNVTAGLDFLWKAAINAELGGQTELCVTSGDYLSGINSSRAPLLKFDGKLSYEEQVIVRLLVNGAISSSQLYLEFQKQLKRSKRQIRNYLISLARRKVLVLKPLQDSNLFFKPVLISLRTH